MPILVARNSKGSDPEAVSTCLHKVCVLRATRARARDDWRALFVRLTVGGRKYVKGEHRVRRILPENGLSIAVLSIILLFLGAESVAG
jgi:hypothetical protein